jgi:hypothetical protein
MRRRFASRLRRRSVNRVAAAVCEGLECRRLLTTFTIDGTAGDDSFIMTVPAPGLVAVTLNGGLPVLINDVVVTNTVLNGLGGNDTFRISATGINPVGAIKINGGANDDLLIVGYLQGVFDYWVVFKRFSLQAAQHRAAQVKRVEWRPSARQRPDRERERDRCSATGRARVGLCRNVIRRGRRDKREPQLAGTRASGPAARGAREAGAGRVL